MIKKVFSSKLIRYSVVFIVVVAIAGTVSVVSAQSTQDTTYRIAVDKAGNMRLLHPSINGKYGNAPKDNEFLIEVPSSQLITMLEERTAVLENTIDGLTATIDELTSAISELSDNNIQQNDLILALQDTISLLEDDVATLVGTIDGLNTIVSTQGNTISSMQADIDALENSVLLLEQRVTALENNPGGDPGDPGEIDISHIPMAGLVFAEKPYAGEDAPAIYEDISGLGNQGTFKDDGEPEWVRLPSGLWTLDYDGVDDYISLGVSDELAPTPVTFLVWINATDFSKAYNCVEGYEDFGRGHTLLIKSNGKLAIYIQVAGVTYYDGTGAHTLTPGSWYLVGFTYNDFSGLKGYVNAVQDASAPAYGLITIPTVHEFRLGSSSLFGGREFDSGIALPKMWNRALSPAEIDAIYQAERVWFEP